MEKGESVWRYPHNVLQTSPQKEKVGLLSSYFSHIIFFLRRHSSGPQSVLCLETLCSEFFWSLAHMSAPLDPC